VDEKPLQITPQTKVGELLKAYPQLEDMLVEVSPAFKKLRNPVLRRTVAKVTSLAQAARVGGVSVVELVQRLRLEVGQPEFADAVQDAVLANATVEPPPWYDESKITETLDARSMIDSGEQPIGIVLRDLDKLEDGQIYELITPFEPAPLIDKARAKGISVWVNPLKPEEFHTYFLRT
jgi:hypothetical protein